MLPNEGAVRCEWCTTPAVAGATSCAACGGPVRLLEPWVLECGWCGRSNRRDETPSCLGCAGPLPTIPGGHPGPRPPEAPRELPPGYPLRVLFTKNVFAIVGAAFTIPFCWTLVFPLAGIPLWVHGHRRARRWLDALERGFATGGEIVSIRQDRTQSINRRHPWRIEFEYETPGGRLKGHVEAWDPAHAQRVPGEHVWVVSAPGDPAVHALWPPVH